MNFFGIGVPEILFILIIALIFVGPDNIGKYARAAGRFLNRFYRSDSWRLVRETSRNLRSLPNRLAREAALEELEEIKRTIRDTSGELNQVQRQLERTENGIANATQGNGEKEVLRLQDSQDRYEGLKAWTPHNTDTDHTQGSSTADETQNAESDR